MSHSIIHTFLRPTFGTNMLHRLPDKQSTPTVLCALMPHSTSKPIAYATPMNVTSAECAFNVSMFNASTIQCSHTPLFNPGEGKSPGLKTMTQHHSQRCLGQDQPKLHSLFVKRESFRGRQDAGSVPVQWCCQVIKTKEPPLVPVLDGVWWLCGRCTYPYLYSTWHGRCAPVTVSDHTYVIYGEAGSSNQTIRRLRRDLDTEQMFQPCRNM